MALRYKAVVFDLDGTLLDTSEGVLSAVRYTIDYFGLPKLSEIRLKKFIGPPIQNSFADAFGIKGDKLQEIATVFRNRYKDADLLKAVPYAGIYDVFCKLTECGIRPTVATYKRQDYATAILTHFGFNRYTDILCGADHENKLKKKDIIENALRAAGVADYTDAVMVGDSDNDAIGAKELGIPFIGVTYGFGFANVDDVKRFPHVGIAADTHELTKLLLQEEEV